MGSDGLAGPCQRAGQWQVGDAHLLVAGVYVGEKGAGFGGGMEAIHSWAMEKPIRLKADVPSIGGLAFQGCRVEQLHGADDQ